MREFFEGLYFKHVAADRSLALIPGRSREESFIQVITDRGAWQAVYPRSAYEKARGRLNVGGSVFSNRGLGLNIDVPGLRLQGRLTYGPLTPLRGPIMGPFQHLPMECRHEIHSLDHSVSGRVLLNGETWEFTGGRGYIEGDSGTSFPTRYAWAQCGFPESGSAVTASAARIPFAGFSFTGCIAVVLIRGRQYRLATYLGGAPAAWGQGILELRQGGSRLLIEAGPQNRQALLAPVRGRMSRQIHESLTCPARFRFYDRGTLLLDEQSDRASFEYAE